MSSPSAPRQLESASNDSEPSNFFGMPSPPEDSDTLFPLNLRPVSPLTLPPRSAFVEAYGAPTSSDPLQSHEMDHGPHFPPTVPLSSDPLLASTQLFRRINGTFRLRRVLHHAIKHSNVTFESGDLLKPSKGRSNIGHSPYPASFLVDTQQAFEQTSVIEYQPSDRIHFAGFEVREQTLLVLNNDGTWDVWLQRHSPELARAATGLHAPPNEWQQRVSLRLDAETLQKYLNGDTTYLWFSTVHEDGRKDRMRIGWSVTPQTEIFEIRHWKVDSEGKTVSESMDELYWLS